MTLIVDEDATCNHTGTVCAGAVAGTVLVGTNGFFTIEGKEIMVDDGTLEVPTHNNPPCTPPNNLSHSFPVDTLAQSFFTIEGKKVVLLGDSSSGDATDIDSQGSNSFMSVT